MAKNKERIESTEDVKKEVERILSFQSVSDEDVEKLKKYYDVSKHDIFDTNKRPNKKRKDVVKNTATGEYESKNLPDHEVNRVAVPDANKIINSAVSFASGNPVKVEYEGGTDVRIQAIKDVLHDNKELPFNRRMCRALFAFREVAEIWYLDEEDSKFRGHLVSPMFGDKLYPIIDRKRKMQSFAYSNSFKNEEGKDIEELVHYTREFTTIYQKDDKGWTIISQTPNVYSKITVVYTSQVKADYEDVISSIDRRNLAISNLGDSVDNSAYPSKFFKGKQEGVMHVPGEGGQYMGDGDADMKIVESSQATSSIELDLKTNKEVIYSQTETADLSLENLKGMGNGLSGETLKRMLTGSILKVQNKREYLDEHYQRRYNIINHMVCYVPKWNPNDLKISCEVVPYIPEDEDAELDRLRKMIGLMPTKHIVNEYKKRIDSSIDEEEIMKWIEEEKNVVDDLGLSYD